MAVSGPVKAETMVIFTMTKNGKADRTTLLTRSTNGAHCGHSQSGPVACNRRKRNNRRRDCVAARGRAGAVSEGPGGAALGDAEVFA